MKKVKIALIIAGVAFLCVAYFAKKAPEADIPLTTVEIGPKVINVGKKSMQEETFAYFVLKNTGDNDLRITDITTDCHCTAITPENEVAAPGDSIILKAEYDNNATGFFNQAITVHLNTMSSPELLIIRGRITE